MGSSTGLKLREFASCSILSRSMPAAWASLRATSKLKSAGWIQLEVARRLQLGIFFVLKIRGLTAPGVAHYLPAIAGHLRLVDQDHRDRPPARCLLEFIRPASIVGERFPFEKIWIVRRRLVHQHEQHFTFQVH